MLYNMYMTLKTSVIIGSIVMTLLTSNISLVSASIVRDLTEEERESGFYHENGYAISSQSARPAINPDFSPDENCLFDVYQLKCIPGSQQECPEGFGNNEDATCFPMKSGEWRCPDGYHGRDDDETGQCYPNEKGCAWDNYVLLENRLGKMDRCAALYIICDDDEYKNLEECIEFCEEDPERFECKPN